jgi:CDP-6-deoxy-D-xylo-4-hexulose-3-dehydrase
MRLDNIEKNITNKTKGIMIPHTLGNPNDMDLIMEIAGEHHLKVIEDSCDALGSKFNGKYVGTFGDFGTFSFYPAHHITTGEGGMVVTNNKLLGEIVRSLRDWGRACTMPICEPISCNDPECPRALKSNKKGLENLPEDYDKRYSYISIGYNLKPIEMQGALGREQLKKLPCFIKKRKENFKILYDEFLKYEDFFILPKWLAKSDPAWFAFPLTVKKNAPFKRKDIIEWYLKNNIEAKLLFSGNIIKHPAYKTIEFRTAEPLKNSEYCMYNTFFLGVYPGLNEEKIKYVLLKTKEFLLKHK